MGITLIYNTIIFIVSLVAVARMITSYGKRAYGSVYRVYSVFCASFAFWCLATFFSALSDSVFWRNIFYYLLEFSKIICYVCIFEILSMITHYYDMVSKKIVHFFSAVYLYLGIFLLFIDLHASKTIIASNAFGIYFTLENKLLNFIRSIYYIIILFGFVFLVVYYYEKCKKKREKFVYKIIIIIVSVAFLALVAEICELVCGVAFIPAALVGFVINMFMMEYLISYQSSIEYRIDDYNEYLMPDGKKSVIICDDKGNILFQNKCSMVIAENFRDSFLGRNLFEIFDVSNIEKIKITQNKESDAVLVRAVYMKADLPVFLSVVNTFDRYGYVFSMIVTVLNEDSVSKEEKDTLREESAPSIQYEKIDIAPENLREMQINDIIEMIDLCAKLYEENKQDLFKYNLIGIKKIAKILGYSAIDDLASRMESACKYGDWQIIDNLLIELDRQAETLRVLRGDM